MKTAATILLILIAVVACGCSAAAPAQQSWASASGSAAVTGIPDLTGTWTGPMQGYDQGTGFSVYRTLIVKMNITEQEGRIFAGKILFTQNGNESASGFAGVVGRDGRTLFITEEYGGYAPVRSWGRTRLS